MASKGYSSPQRQGRGTQRDNKDKKPRLTHFLCLPLINQTSIPQLVSSLAGFKASMPLIPPNVPAHVAAAAQLPDVPLVPDGAFRPLGTLHLTLGVMRLPTRERLDEALNFLQSLDLESMLREVEAEAGLILSNTERTTSTTTETTTRLPPASAGPLQPLSISLTSLSAIPSARAATVLHAEPVDPTSRLYPFSVKLREKFIEAGFMECEMIKDPKWRKGKAGAALDAEGDGYDNPTPTRQAADISVNVEQGEISDAETSKSSNISQPMIPRPLLLHATVVNTIYLGKRRQRGGKDKGKKETYKFDARQLLGRYKNYSASGGGGDGNEGPGNLEAHEGLLHTQEREKFPFIWARDIPLDRLCICEMGAKPVPYDETKGGPVLGEKYAAVGERILDFASGGREIDDEEEGGVKIT
ncbi:hypothetical protein AJ80_00994 [Polytolypa hystricis UAMH7299]|uniref:A-kinase anchor protein 7-like phosphoesterase domain-containing protein n=1 Tax=Polytolypa hystricis (strain UAMH7299) TaxID=1447883 RepID=A0A2B7YTB7_POLH7|nr:hypothetical protein AJ80_00994 [Polytolypa hystricis UAMH7299]